MDIFLMEDIKRLIHHRDGALVSMYIPTHRAGAEVQQDSIRLKNMLSRSEEELVEAGLSRTEVDSILKPAYDLLHESDFWNRQSDGLALFLSSDWFRTYRLPERFEEIMVVADRFHIKPLIPLISNDLRFFLLTLSMDQVRLYQGDRYHLEDIDTEAFPENIDGALRHDDPERELQFHTQTDSPVSTAGRPAEYHGHSVSSESKKKDRIERFLQLVEQGVYELIGDQTAPLLLAGVDYLLAMYREANNYRNLLEDGIVGNPDRKSSQELHGEATTILETIIQKKRKQLASQYPALREQDKASDRLTEVIPAAYRGRVRTFFVARDREVWGSFNPETQKVKIFEEPVVGAEDLLDLAVVQTLINGGEVYSVRDEEVPGGGVISAIFRY